MSALAKFKMPVGSFRLLLDGVARPGWPTTVVDIKRACELIEKLEPLQTAGDSDAENDEPHELDLDHKQVEAARKCIKFWLSRGAYSPKGYALPLITAFLDEGS